MDTKAVAAYIERLGVIVAEQTRYAEGEWPAVLRLPAPTSDDEEEGILLFLAMLEARRGKEVNVTFQEE